MSLVEIRGKEYDSKHNQSFNRDFNSPLRTRDTLYNGIELKYDNTSFFIDPTQEVIATLMIADENEFLEMLDYKKIRNFKKKICNEIYDNLSFPNFSKREFLHYVLRQDGLKKVYEEFGELNIDPNLITRYEVIDNESKKINEIFDILVNNKKNELGLENILFPFKAKSIFFNGHAYEGVIPSKRFTNERKEMGKIFQTAKFISEAKNYNEDSLEYKKLYSNLKKNLRKQHLGAIDLIIKTKNKFPEIVTDEIFNELKEQYFNIKYNSNAKKEEFFKEVLKNSQDNGFRIIERTWNNLFYDVVKKKKNYGNSVEFYDVTGKGLMVLHNEKLRFIGGFDYNSTDPQTKYNAVKREFDNGLLSIFHQRAFLFRALKNPELAEEARLFSDFRNTKPIDSVSMFNFFKLTNEDLLNASSRVKTKFREAIYKWIIGEWKRNELGVYFLENDEFINEKVISWRDNYDSILSNQATCEDFSLVKIRNLEEIPEDQVEFYEETQDHLILGESKRVLHALKDREGVIYLPYNRDLASGDVGFLQYPEKSYLFGDNFEYLDFNLIDNNHKSTYELPIIENVFDVIHMRVNYDYEFGRVIAPVKVSKIENENVGFLIHVPFAYQRGKKE